jgi:hypothetical protein
VAFTGILATMPYIALQFVGIQAVLTVLGIGGTSGNAFVKDLPLLIAFIILAAYTYLAGLRAPALIAFVKDTLIYVMVIVAILYIPTRRGHHVDRRRQLVHPQHLPGVLPARRQPGARDPGRAGRLAGRQARCADLRAGLAQDVLHQPAAARRHLDPADLPRDRGRPVHPVVPPVGAAFIINLVVAVVLTVAFRALRLAEGSDETSPASYTADPEQATPPQLPAVAGTQPS